MVTTSWCVGLAAAAASTFVVIRRLRKTSPHKITVISSRAHAEVRALLWHAALRFFSKPLVLGLDVEWVKGSCCPAALLQLSTGAHTLLFRLCAISRTPGRLLALLQDERVLKAGVGIKQDLHRLEAWAASHGAPAGFAVGGAVDLVPLARQARLSGEGLATLSTQVLHEPLHKERAVRCSNWEADVLTEQQVQYAANDARASVRLFMRLRQMADSCAGGSIVDSGIAHSSIGAQRGAGGQGAAGRDRGQNGKCKGKAVRLPARSRPMYDGWLMEDERGQPMCRMAERRARWYLSRGLARLVESGEDGEAPGRTIRLNFTPNGHGNAEEPWLLQGKRNVCVGCGVEQDAAAAAAEASPAPACEDGQRQHTQHVRFSVVPHAFRKHLPPHMKSRDSHDVVLVCTGCYARLAQPYERHRAAAFVARGVAKDADSRLETDPLSERMRSAAVALTAHGAALPAARRAELEAQLADVVGRASGTLSHDEICDLARRPRCRRERADWVAPEARLMAAVHAEGEAAVHAFVRSWRILFVDTLTPNHMPEGWTVDHRRSA